MTTTPEQPVSPTDPDGQPDVVPSLDPDQPMADPQTHPAPDPDVEPPAPLP
ncbi:hypothetical protein [Nocardioides dongxiaopingii]|uniref:hypothetical protein n=1 Tax=Nocardioides TaxID=1839 RepID=UPI001485B1B4|nr:MULTISPECIES: hypothetical protein [Nocardioides]